jgi:transcription initiation factor IIF auxiliary subunit
LKSTASSKVVFDMTRAVKGEGTLEIPVFFASDEDVTSIDFALQFNEESLTYGSVVKNVPGLESADHFNTDDRTLRFTAYSLKNIEAGTKVATVRFNTYADNVKASDLSGVSALINGKIAELAVLDAGAVNEVSVDYYPNPAHDVLNVVVSADAKVVLMDITGKSILFETEVNANQKKEINVSDLRNGLYLMKVYSNDFVSNSKVVIQK